MDVRKDECMSYKWIGAIMIFLACGGFGFSLAASELREEAALRELARILDFMECELQYRLTPLPQLCRQAAHESSGAIRKVFAALSERLDEHASSDVAGCMCGAVADVAELPSASKAMLLSLGNSMGRFDLVGQLKGLDCVRHECREKLSVLSENKQSRLRSYQTLGLCAGAALAILFI